MLVLLRRPSPAQRAIVPALLIAALAIPRTVQSQDTVHKAAGPDCDATWMPKSKSAIENAMLSAIVYPYDAKRELPTEYERFIAIGLHQSLRLPHPLPLDTYEYMPMYHPDETVPFATAFASTYSAYKVVLHQDGHLVGAKAVGGIRNPALDSSVVSALITVDTLRLLPPLSPATDLGPEGLELRIVLRSFASDSLPPHAVVEPLARMRLPLFDADSAPSKVPNQDSPLYPIVARRAQADGDVLAMFVIEPSGSVDPNSIQFLKATATQFAESTLQSLLQTKFVPMRIGGCPVRTLARMGFEYRLHR